MACRADRLRPALRPTRCRRRTTSPLIAHAATLQAARPVPPLLRRLPHLARGRRRSRSSTDDDLRAMIDEDAGRRPPPARALRPDHPVMRGTAQNPDVYFQARETVNRFYDACPGSSRRPWTGSPSCTGRQLPPVRLRRRTRRRARDRLMGSGAETAHETVDYLVARGEKVGVLKVRLYRPFASTHFVAALPKTVQDHRRARPHQGAGRRRRAALPGRASPRSPRRVPTAERLHRRAARRRRPLRPLLQGVHPGHGQGASSTSSARPSPRTTSPSASTTTSPTAQPRLRRRRSTSSPTTCAGRVLRPGLATAPSAPTRTPSRSSARTPTTTPRATSSTTPRRPARSPSRHLRFGPQPIRSAYLSPGQLRRLPRSRSFLEKYRHARRRRAGRRRSCSTPPYPPTRSGTRLPREVQEQIIDKKLEVLRHRRLRASPRRPGMGGRINTIMQTCFFSLSRRAAAGRGDRRRSRRPSRRPTASGATRSCSRTTPRSTQAARQPARGQGARAPSPAARHRPPAVPRAGAGVRPAASPRRCIAGKGDLLPVSAFPVDGTWPTGTTQWEKRNIAAGDPGLGAGRSASSAASARWSARTPPSAPRSTTRRRWRTRPPTFKSHRRQGQGVRRA